jgi:hypothetical protein
MLWIAAYEDLSVLTSPYQYRRGDPSDNAGPRRSTITVIGPGNPANGPPLDSFRPDLL